MRLLAMLPTSVLCLCVLTLAASGRADDAKTAAKITYTDQIQPILREHCFICHNQNKARNDLALDSYERLMQGGASGEPIEPGDPDASYLWLLVTHEDEPAMPPEQDKLPEAKLALIKQWIEGGALKDTGSKAKSANKPAIDLSVSSGANKPEGPAAMPEGLPRVGLVATARPGAITALASSPWAPLLAMAGQKQILFYQSDTAELLGALAFAEGVPQALRFSRSGTLLLAGGGHAARLGRVVLFDVRNGSRVTELGDESDVVLAADINQNHTLVALAGPGRVVRAFRTADGSPAYTLKKHTDWVLALQFSPDGILLATADRSAGVQVWEAETGTEYLALAGHKGSVTAVSWRADSNLLATASEDGTVKLWEMEQGRTVKSINAHSGGVTDVEFARDGRLVTAGRDKQIKVWDTAGKNLKTLGPMADLPLAVTFDHEGKRVVAGDFSGEIRVWTVDDGKQVATLVANPPTEEQAKAATASDTTKAP